MNGAVGIDAAEPRGALETRIAEQLAGDEAFRLLGPQLTGLGRDCAKDASKHKQTTRQHVDPHPQNASIYGEQPTMEIEANYARISSINPE